MVEECLLSGRESGGGEEVGHQREGGGELDGGGGGEAGETGGKEEKEFRILTQPVLLSRFLGQPLMPPLHRLGISGLKFLQELQGFKPLVAFLVHKLPGATQATADSREK